MRDKLQRRDAISAIKKDVMQSLAGRAEADGWNAGEMSKEFGELEYQTMRGSVLDTKVRIDGRAARHRAPDRIAGSASCRA